MSQRFRRFVDFLDENSAALLACDCAERALPILEDQCKGNTAARRCIEVRRRHVVGRATMGELRLALMETRLVGKVAPAVVKSITWASMPNLAKTNVIYAARNARHAIALLACQDVNQLQTELDWQIERARDYAGDLPRVYRDRPFLALVK